jgi:microsomal dipeptidase-like Zn-dependent dipeptidase
LAISLYCQIVSIGSWYSSEGMKCQHYLGTRFLNGGDYHGFKRLEDISRTPALTRRLLERGHSDAVVLKILGANYLRVFEQVWS